MKKERHSSSNIEEKKKNEKQNTRDGLKREGELEKRKYLGKDEKLMRSKMFENNG